MTCPDNLLIAARRGALREDERARLDGHLASCASCRLTLRVGADFDRVLETVPGDDLIAARFARNLGPKLSGKRRGRARVAWLAAGAVIASAGLAAAATLGALSFMRGEPEAPSLPATPSAPEQKQQPSRAPEREPPSQAPANEAPAVEEETRTPRAAELFAQANARRREGQPARARSLYRQLQQLYPRSPEVEVSRVSLGRVHLELGEPEEALEQFERYLKKSPRGPLAEEALFGKAGALQRLGRPADERATWQALLDGYPSSVYADRARARLEHLP